MPKYLNTGTKPVHTGHGVCWPGEHCTFKKPVDNPNLTQVKKTTKKAAKK